jgi:hypothetical protein
VASPRSLVGQVLVGISRFGFTGLPRRKPSIIKQVLNCINQMIYKYRFGWNGHGVAVRPLDTGEQVHAGAVRVVRVSEVPRVFEKGR